MPSHENTIKDQELIVKYNPDGDKIQIERSSWREKILLPSIQKHWDSTEKLYQTLVTALLDGFTFDLLPAAYHFSKIDTRIERGCAVLAIVQMKSGQFDAAESTLYSGIKKIGETGVLLVNLAKLFAERGDEKQAHETLWKAIECDPNVDSGLIWWAEIQKKRYGGAKYLEALENLASLPGSWRIKLWIAKYYLEKQEIDRARAIYAEILASGLHDDFDLSTILKDLSENRQESLMLDLVAPVYNEKKNDISFGVSLLKAYLKLRRLDEGEALLARLFALDRSSHKKIFERLAGSFKSCRFEQENNLPPSAMTLERVYFDRPIWRYGLLSPGWLFVKNQLKIIKFYFFHSRK